MSTFLVANIRKKPFRASRGPYTSIHQGLYTTVHTPRSVHQTTFEVSNVYTPNLYLYSKKLKKCPFFGYLYKKNPFRAFNHPYTSVHQHAYTNIRTLSYF